MSGFVREFLPIYIWIIIELASPDKCVALR